jgi:hypothetical protein
LLSKKNHQAIMLGYIYRFVLGMVTLNRLVMMHATFQVGGDSAAQEQSEGDSVQKTRCNGRHCREPLKKAVKLKLGYGREKSRGQVFVA